MRHISLILLALCLPLWAVTAPAAAPDYAALQIWALDEKGLPVPMGLSLGQFANYLQGRQARMKLLVLDKDLLELRVSDPRMNLHEHLVHTYVFEPDWQTGAILCNHFLLNGQELSGQDFFANTTLLFRIVAGQANKYSSSHDFQIIDKIPDQPLGADDFYAPPAPAQRDAEICGRLLVSLPVNQHLNFILLDQGGNAQPYFSLKDSCQLEAENICARILQKVKGNPQLNMNGIKLNELNFIHQCRPQQ